MNQTMEELWESSHMSAGHAGYLESLYETYLSNPKELPEEWLVFFKNLPIQPNSNGEISHKTIISEFKNMPRNSEVVKGAVDERQGKVIRLIQAYRNRGHQEAKLDPLGMMERNNIEDLNIEFHGLSQDDLDDEFYTDTFSTGSAKTSLREIVNSLRNIYCGTIGVEYNYIMESNERRWLQKKFESKLEKYNFSKENKLHIYERLNSAEGLAKYLAAKYPGMKRFGIDGAESLVPLIDAVIQDCGELGANQICFGMAHRGRLNLLVNVLGKLPE
jgi:2-oxoglutarate dehydrogenase E1 component